MSFTQESQWVLTLVVNDDAVLLENSQEFIIDFLKENQFELMKKNYLDKEKKNALDLYFTNYNSKSCQQIYLNLKKLLEDKKIDICLQPFESILRKKKLILADMDSTMIANETLNDLGMLAGIGEEVAKITKLGIEGEIDFKTSLKMRVALLKGLEGEKFFKKVISQIKINQGAKTFVQTVKANHTKTILVSGGFSPIADWVKEKIGFDDLICNRFEISNGFLTGKLVNDYILPETKLEVLEKVLKAKGMVFDFSMVVGDGANDIPVLKATAMGVAYRAVEKVKEEIIHQINHTSLTTLLYYQGYYEEEFIHHD